MSLAHAMPGVPRGSGYVISLSRRQNDTGTPPQCASTCDPVATIAPTCPSEPSQCCTQLFQSGYFNCLMCVGLADNVTAAGFAVAQQSVDNFTVECSELGFSLPKLTLPGQNVNRTLSTVSAGSHPSTNSAISQITVSALPTSLASSPTVTQKTVTTLSSQSAALPSSLSTSSGPAAPTTSANAAHGARFNLGLLIMAGWAMLYMHVG